MAMQAAVRRAGAVPAITAVLGGKLCVGLDDTAIVRLAADRDMLKLGRRDLAHAVLARRDGATTVSATMICARLAGITVMATGGIGGVHRGVEGTLDISADLDELAINPVTVVCSGAKAILDLPRTLEYLETRGVPVVGFGTDDFPAFFLKTSGLPVTCRVDSAAALAAMIAAQRALGLGGIVVANPPPDGSALDPSATEAAIVAAVAEADSRGVRGKELTPFLLERIAQATDGESVLVNRALLESNAVLAARIAVAVATDQGVRPAPIREERAQPP
jgi:pseudouridine-5'-phosphate glycosidase